MEHDRPYGVVWKEWSGVEPNRKLHQKSQGFFSRHIFNRYITSLSKIEGVESFDGGWRPEGPLSGEEVQQLVGGEE